MRNHLLLLGTILAPSSWCLELKIAPFTHPASATAATPVPGSAAHGFDLIRRDGNCPLSYNSCSNEGNSGLCCQAGTTCTVDGANNYACCPTGAQCTGTLGATATDSTSTSGFIFPQGTTTTTTTNTPQASITGSTVPGAAYPFVYIPTSFGNAATCSSYYSYCQSEYTSCIVSLGGQYGVTIVGGNGGGVTIQGNGATLSASAAVSTCSSLSRQACYGLQESYCMGLSGSGSAATTTSSGHFVAGNYAARRKSSLHELLVAAAAGVFGMFI